MRNSTYFKSFDYGVFEKNGFRVEYFGQDCIPERNIILKFTIKNQFGNRTIDLTTIEETKYIQKRLHEKFGESSLEKGEIDIKIINDFIALTYYEMMI